MQCIPVLGIGEIREGDDLAGAILERFTPQDGDILVVTSKIVSKAEGRRLTGDRAGALEAETTRVLARRGETAIVRNRQGLVLAGAGIDASNTEPGTVLLLPEDPDRSAGELRAAIEKRTGARVGVVISDTAGRAWRQGQTDIAIGAAGLLVADDHAGRFDPHGNELAVTLTAVADEVASAGDLVKGKLRGCPVAVVRGLGHLLTEAGPGARSLQRSDSEDLFGLGARQSALAALGVVDVDQSAFGAPATPSEILAVLEGLPGAHGTLTATAGGDGISVAIDAEPVARAALEVRVAAACFACGWRAVAVEEAASSGIWRQRFAPGT